MFRFVCVLGALVVVPAACSSPTAAVPERIEEAYLLESVNGRALPYSMVEDGSARVEVLGRSVRLRADGSFEDHLELLVADAAGTSPLVTHRLGRWSRAQGRLVLSYTASGRTSTGRVEGPVLELDDRGVSFLLRR